MVKSDLFLTVRLPHWGRVDGGDVQTRFILGWREGKGRQRDWVREGDGDVRSIFNRACPNTLAWNEGWRIGSGEWG